MYPPYSMTPPPTSIHTVTNHLNGVGFTLPPTTTSPSNWHNGKKDSEVKEHAYMLLRTQVPLFHFKMRTHPCHCNKEGNSEVFLNALFKTPNAPAPKPHAFFWGAEGCHLRKKGIPSKFLWGEESLVKSSKCQNTCTGLPSKRFPAAELGWPVERPVSGSTRPPHPFLQLYNSLK